MINNERRFKHWLLSNDYIEKFRETKREPSLDDLKNFLIDQCLKIEDELGMDVDSEEGLEYD